MKLPSSILAKRKRKKAFKEALSIVAAVKKMVDAGAIIFDRETRRVDIVQEIFWQNKTEAWRTNFCQNIKLFMDITQEEENQTPITIHRIDIDKKQIANQIATYNPSTATIS